MGIARGVAKAAKAAKKQTRGLQGNRNSQGDFMTGENKLDTDRFAASEMMARDKVADSVTPDIQNYIDDVKSQIDEIDTRSSNLPQNDYESLMENLVHKEELLGDLIDKLGDDGIEVPPQVSIEFKDTQSQIRRLNDELGPEFGNDMANREPELPPEEYVY
jgi:hypothetical protein